MSGIGIAVSLALVITLVPDRPAADGPVAAAEMLLARGERAAAIARLEAAVAGEASAEAVLLLGRLHLEDAPARARQLAAAVLRERPLDRVGLDLLSAAHARARALGPGRVEELAQRRQEVSDYSQLLRAEPRLAEARYRRASQWLAIERLLPAADRQARRRSLKEALADLEALQTLLAEAPAVFQASVHYQHGRARKHLADLAREADGKPVEALRSEYTLALDAFEAALAADPDRVDALAEQVLVLRDLGAIAQAIASLREQRGSGRTRLAQAKVEVMLATLLLETGSHHEALTALTHALELEPAALDAYLAQWQALRALGREADAAAALDAALEQEPRFIDAWYRLGEAAANAGRLEEAEGRFTRILDIPVAEAVSEGKRPSASQHRAGVYARSAAWLAWLSLQQDTGAAGAEAALRYAILAERHAHADAYLLDTRGQALLRLGREEQAREVLLQAQRMEAFASLEFHLAQVEAALGNRHAAEAALQRALAGGEFRGRAQAEALLASLRAGSGADSPGGD